MSRPRIVMLFFFYAILGIVSLVLGALWFYSPGEIAALRDKDGNLITGSISEKIFVSIGGVKQGIIIRGVNSQNPVLLFVHGGPGMPTYFLTETYPTGLEKKFVVCYWEQRHAGISYNNDESPEKLSTDILVSDAIEVTRFLCNRFRQDKIYLMGHSWGSFIGIQAASKSPELYSAYMGVSQISNQATSERLAYSFMVQQYESLRNMRMVQKLGRYSTQPEEALINYFRSPLRDQAMHDLGVGTTHDMKSVISGVFFPVMKCKAYTISEKINLWRAKHESLRKSKLIYELLNTDLTSRITKLIIPVYFMSGKFDYTVNCSLSASYLEKIEAPVKGFYTFHLSAHSPMHEEPAKFLEIITTDVLKGVATMKDPPKLFLSRR